MNPVASGHQRQTSFFCDTHRRPRGLRFRVFWVLALVACGESEAPKPFVQGPPQTLATPSDPGPQFKIEGGVRPVASLDPITARTSALQTLGGVHYVLVDVPEQTVPLISGPLDGARITLDGLDAHGVGVPAGAGLQTDKPWFYLRLTGAALPQTFDVVWEQESMGNGFQAKRQRITVQYVRSAPKRDHLKAAFHSAAAVWFAAKAGNNRRYVNPFFAFAAGRLARMSGEVASSEGRFGPLGRTYPETELHRLLAPSLSRALRAGALQLELGIRQNAKVSARDRPLEKISKLSLRQHPWSQWVDEKLRMEPLARWAPADSVYIHMHWPGEGHVRLSEWRNWWHRLETLISLGFSFPVADGGLGIFLAQIGLQDLDELQTILGSQKASLAWLLSNPSFDAVDDLTVLVQAADIKTVKSRWSARFGSVAQSVTLGSLDAPNAQAWMWKHHEGTKTYIAAHEDVLIISNSLLGLRAPIEARQGVRSALADANDFRYYRSRKPWRSSEDLLVYAGEEFMLSWLSTDVRITTARRTAARAELVALNHAELLYRWLNGRGPDGIRAMKKDGLIEPHDLRHQADGHPIQFSVSKGASSRWGYPGLMKPSREFMALQATAGESNAFGRLREGFDNDLRPHLMPMALRFAGQEQPNFSFFRGMMLVHEGWSQWLSLLVPGTLAEVQAPTGLSLELNLSPSSKPRAKIEVLLKDTLGRRDMRLDWFGQALTIGVLERSAIRDLMIGLEFVDNLWVLDPENKLSVRKSLLSRFPAYAVAEVANHVALQEFISGAEVAVSQLLERALEQQKARYGDTVYHCWRETLTDEGARLGVCYAIVRDRFIVALDESSLLGLIDHYKTPSASATGPIIGEAHLQFRPQATGHIEFAANSVLSLFARSHHRAVVDAYQALNSGDGWVTKGASEKRAYLSTRIGHEPQSIFPGNLEYMAGSWVHPVLGSRMKAMVPASPAIRDLSGLPPMSMLLTSEVSGARRGTWLELQTFP